MTRIADLSIGESNYDARFLKILEDSGVEQ